MPQDSARHTEGGVTRSPSLLLLTVAVTACGCDRPATEAPRAAAPDPTPLYVSPVSAALQQRPDLVEKLAAGAHEYYRFINVPFAREVCRAFEGDVPTMPAVTLHGDAHLEQYAVTEAGRGLTDFDDTATGPAVIDLVRFGGSIRLASRDRGWGDAAAEQAWRRFLAGYREGLRDPTLEPPEPPLVRRLEAGFETSRAGFLSWADGLMGQLDETTAAALGTALVDYVREQTLHGDLPQGFFAVKRAGRIGLGIGSALDEKYLLRLEGPTPDDLDDVIVEAKQVRDLAQVECIRPGAKANPFRVLIGHVRVPYRPYLGFFRLHGRSFWVHAWLGNYAELAVGDLAAPEELAQVSYEAGLQLARAHFGDFPAEVVDTARNEQRRVLVREADRIERTVADLAARSERAWERFRADAAGHASRVARTGG